MLLSKLNNDMRKDKSVSGTKSMLRKGFWPYSTPLGYTSLNKHTTADKHLYVVNQDGLLLKKVFRWKASGKITNQQIVERLNAQGLKISLRHIAQVLANPFYCGYINASILEGEIIKGKHPILIDENTFMIANNIGNENPRHDVLKMRHQVELSLKVFMKNVKNENPLTGYLNKKKKIFYYKSRNTGSNVSINAKN